MEADLACLDCKVWSTFEVSGEDKDIGNILHLKLKMAVLSTSSIEGWPKGATLDSEAWQFAALKQQSSCNLLEVNLTNISRESRFIEIYNITTAIFMIIIAIIIVISNLI